MLHSGTIVPEQLYQQIVRELTTFAMFAVSSDGTLLTWNRGVEALLGYSEEEFKALRFEQLFTQEDRKAGRPQQELETAAKAGNAPDRRMHVRKDSSLVFVDGTLNKVTDASGNLLAFSKVIRDASEEEQAKAETEQALRYAESVIDTAHESMLVLDSELRVETANQAFYRLFGLSPEQTAGKLVYDLGSGQWNIPRLRDLLKRMLPEQALIEDFAVDHEFPAIGLRNMVLNARVLQQKAASPGRILLTIEDVTERHRSQREVQLQKSLLQATLHSIGDGVITTDTGGKVSSLNQVAEKLTGWKAEEATGELLSSVFRIVSEETGADVPNPALLALEQGQVTALDIRTVLVDRQGVRHSIDDSAAPIRDADGAIVGAVLVFRDIGERRDLERLHERLLAQLSALLASTTEGIYTIDVEGRCTLINDAAINLLGYSREECLGRNMHELIHHHRPDGSHYAQEHCPIFHAKDRSSSVRVDEEVFWRKDGSPLPVDFSSAPLTVAGKRMGAVISFSDLTERRKLELERKEEAARLRLAMESARMVSWTWQPQSNLVSASQNLAEIYGSDAIQSLQTGMSLVIPEDRERHSAAVVSAAENQTGYSSEFRIVRPDNGAQVWLEERAIFTPGGSATSGKLTGITIDVTEKRQIQRDLEAAHKQLGEKATELERSNEDLSQFAAIAGHDLQTPLRIINSYAELIARKYGRVLDEDGRQYLTFMTTAAQSMQNLISGLLEYARFGAQRVDEVVVLNDLLEHLRELLRPIIGETQAAVTWDQLPVVNGDNVQLRQLFQNLIVNALKYRAVARAPQIQVSVETEESFWQVSVRDNGLGIAPEYWETIFRPLKRLHGAEIPGTGLGLAVCRRIVENHGGQIWVDSKPGEGSIFKFTLSREQTRV